MTIQLKQLILVNFKGIRNKGINLNPNGESFIYGDNATGKTTVFDAFTWLLFGKDSAGRADFEIKTLTPEGHVIEKLDHEVTGVLIIDGKETELKRVFREKWVKKRGSEVTEFEGNETLLSVNGVPKKANEFRDYIGSLINENIFKLITSPTAFNSLKWEERRKILTEISGSVSNDEIVASMGVDSDRKQWLLNLLASDKSIADHKKEIASKVKALKDEIKTIPTRIDEVERSKPDLTDAFNAKDLEVLQKEIESIDLQITNKSESFNAEISKVNEKKKVLLKLEGEIEACEKRIKKDVEAFIADRGKLAASFQIRVDEINEQITRFESALTRKRSEAVNIKAQIEEAEKKIVAKRDEWQTVNAQEFTYDSTSICCPTCKQELKDKDRKIEELKARFNTNKSNRIEEISAEGLHLKSTLEDLQNDLKKSDSDLKAVESEIETLKVKLKTEQEKVAEASKANAIKPADELIAEHSAIDLVLINFKAQHAEMEKEIYAMSQSIGVIDNSELINKKAEVNAEIDRLKAIQQKIAENDKACARIEELKQKEKELAQAQAQIERDEFLINKFTRANIEQVESKVNAMFEIVKFKMFEQQINGGESETCVCTVNGVSYPDLNNAMKIQAGLDIIKTMSTYYKLSAPIFIDNRESVVSIGKYEAQIINLVVSEPDKELRVV